MNKLITTNLGGVSFDWDDWRFEQNGVREAFLGLLSAWGVDPSDSFIISGCVSTVVGANYSITAGFIALGGEIFKVDAHTVPVFKLPIDEHYWTESITYDPTGLEATKNLGTVNTYEIRRAVVVAAIPPASYLPMLADRIEKKIADSVKPFFGAWTTLDLTLSTDVVQNDATDGLGNDIQLVQQPQAGSYLKYLVIGKIVFIVFDIKSIFTTNHTISSAGSIKINNLPFAFKSGQRQTGVYNGRSTNAQSVQGANEIEAEAGGNSLIMKLRTPSSAAGFNRTYQFTSTVDFAVSATATVTQVEWDLMSSLAFEIN